MNIAIVEMLTHCLQLVYDEDFCIKAEETLKEKEISLLLEPCHKGADIVSGYRAHRQDHFVRRLNAFGWNTLVRLLFGHLCRDIDCGFKLFRR